MKFKPKESLQFTIDPSGKPTGVTLGVKAYVTLLVQANVTDPELWPPGFKEGATALARVREIESNCIIQHGEFDWEKLTPAVQDEYDTLCVLLDELQEDNGRLTWEEYQAEHEEERG
jgi:hypothetical protein